MLIVTLTGVLLIGVALVAVGLRGRRTDDHPVCRRCGYDLTGRAGDRCPECGRDLGRRRAVRTGHRVRRRSLLAFGGLVVAAAVASGSAVGWVRVRGVDPTPYKPSWWLQRELGDATLRDRALAELTARLTAGKLSPARVAAVADRALAAQAGPPGSWAAAWARSSSRPTPAVGWTAAGGRRTAGRRCGCR